MIAALFFLAFAFLDCLAEADSKKEIEGYSSEVRHTCTSHDSP